MEESTVSYQRDRLRAQTISTVILTPYPQRSKPRTHFIIPAIVLFKEAGMMRPS